MIAKTFVDSNILIYAHDADAGSKQQRAADHLTKLWESRTGLLSTQVLQKFYVKCDPEDRFAACCQRRS